MRRASILIAAFSLFVVAAASADIASAKPHSYDAKTRGRTATQVMGGLTTAPTGIPTGGDPNTMTIQGYSTEQWTGSWLGVSIADIKTAHLDPSTGDITGTIVDTFTGIYTPDHSHGTLTIAETFTGNLFTGAGLLEGDIAASSGDPTFQCSSGHVDAPFYFNAVAGFGGYSGTWFHGCH
jgi:hypothetical protein